MHASGVCLTLMLCTPAPVPGCSWNRTLQFRSHLCASSSPVPTQGPAHTEVQQQPPAALRVLSTLSPPPCHGQVPPERPRSAGVSMCLHHHLSFENTSAKQPWAGNEEELRSKRQQHHCWASATAKMTPSMQGTAGTWSGDTFLLCSDLLSTTLSHSLCLP